MALEIAAMITGVSQHGWQAGDASLIMISAHGAPLATFWPPRQPPPVAMGSHAAAGWARARSVRITTLLYATGDVAFVEATTTALCHIRPNARYFMRRLRYFILISFSLYVGRYSSPSRRVDAAATDIFHSDAHDTHATRISGATTH